MGDSKPGSRGEGELGIAAWASGPGVLDRITLLPLSARQDRARGQRDERPRSVGREEGDQWGHRQPDEQRDGRLPGAPSPGPGLENEPCGSGGMPEEGHGHVSQRDAGGARRKILGRWTHGRMGSVGSEREEAAVGTGSPDGWPSPSNSRDREGPRSRDAARESRRRNARRNICLLIVKPNAPARVTPTRPHPTREHGVSRGR